MLNRIIIFGWGRGERGEGGGGRGEDREGGGGGGQREGGHRNNERLSNLGFVLILFRRNTRLYPGNFRLQLYPPQPNHPNLRSCL